MSGPRVAIRLGTEGAGEVRNDFAGIKNDGKSSFDAVGAAAEASASRASRAYDRATADVEAALRRQSAAAARVAAVAPQTGMQQRINAAVGIGDTAGSARVSAAAIQELIRAEEQLERRTIALRSALDPLFAAQQRYNAEVREAKMLLDAGRISTDLYAQAELRAKTALDAATAAQTRNNAAAGRSRMAMQQLGFQINDVTTSLAGGINPAMVFAQQSGQVAYALSMMEGKLGAVGRFMAGPWGAILGGAVTVLGLFGAKLLTGASAAETQKEATDELTSATKALNDLTKSTLITEDQRLALALRKAAALTNEAIATRELTKARLDEARRQQSADLEGARAGSPDPNRQFRLQNAPGVIAALEKESARQDEQIARARATLQNGIIVASMRSAALATDEAAAATKKYQDTVAELGRQFRAGEIGKGELDAGIRKATEAREAATKADSTGKDARTALAKAARDAAAADREMESTLSSLIAKFDPVTAAARTYADQLRDIAKLQAAGKIDGDQARRLRYGMETAEEKRLRDAAEKELSSGLLRDGRKPLVDLTTVQAIETPLKKAEEKMKALQAQGAELFDRVLSPDAWRDWGAAGLRAIDAIKQELFTLAVINPLKNLLFNTGAPTLAGIPAIAAAIGRNASGTEYWSGGATYLAENGPEIVDLPRGARVTPASQTRQILRESASSSAPVFSFDLRGAVITEDLLRQMNAIGDQAAVRGAAGGSRLAQADMARGARRRLY